MQFVVEDGTGLAGATAYLSEADLFTYAAFVGADIGSGDPAAAIVRGSRWVDAAFEARFPGYRLKGRSQGLAWPRTGAYDPVGGAIRSDGVPGEVVRAAAEASLRELSVAGSLMPDETGGPEIKREWFDGIGGTEYAERRVASPRFGVIEGILAPLIGRSGAGMIRLVRA